MRKPEIEWPHFTEPEPIPSHTLARQFSRLMLLEYKRRDRREI